MPLKLIAPKAGRSPYWRIRGTYLHIYIDRSTGATDRRIASQILAKTKGQIERGELAPNSGPTWKDAAVSYVQAHGATRFLDKLTVYWGDTPLVNFTQAGIDACAASIYPTGSLATRNRQVHTPIMAVLNHAGHALAIRRPKGGNGQRRTCYLEPAQLFRVLDAADAMNPEFGILLTLLTYCGPRVSEALSIECDDLNLQASTAYIRDTKNGEPQMLHLPPPVVAALANHPRGLERPGERVFSTWTTAGTPKEKMAFYALAHAVFDKARIDPQGAPFHIFRHTYATQMKRLGVDLLFTGRWKSRQASDGYAHVTGEARKADMLPTRAKSVRSR